MKICYFIHQRFQLALDAATLIGVSFTLYISHNMETDLKVIFKSFFLLCAIEIICELTDLDGTIRLFVHRMNPGKKLHTCTIFSLLKILYLTFIKSLLTLIQVVLLLLI